MRRHAKVLFAIAALVSFFAFASVGNADSCPNATVRAQQGTSALADCRAYEQVSPVDKQGNDIDRGFAAQVAPSGDGVAYYAFGAFAGAEGSTLGEYYLSHRDGQGWGTRPIDASQSNPKFQIGQNTVAFSRDLSTAFQISANPLAPGAFPGGTNLYRLDTASNTRSLQLGWADPTPGAAMSAVAFHPPTPVTPDLSHAVFGFPAALVPDAVPGVPNLYDGTESGLQLVNYMPDGSPAPEGGGVGSPQGTHNSRSISEDGTRIVFSTPPGPLQAIYVRIDGQDTVAVSASQRTGEEGVVVPASFAGASADGSTIDFLSATPLTDDSEQSGASGNLYRFDVDTETLTNLIPGREGGVWKVLESSADGEYVYFASVVAHTPGTTDGESNLYLWHAGALKHVATLPPEEFTGPWSFSMSPGGRYLAFGSFGSPTGYDNHDAACEPEEGTPSGVCGEVFVYDAAGSGALSCVTCVATDEKGNSTLDPQVAPVSEHFKQAMLEDGTVVFTSRGRLLPADVNGKADVYRWRDGDLALVSSGLGTHDSTFADASPDGRDVFFYTATSLVAQDSDFSVDIYDARIGGGVSSQNVRPPLPSICEGESCRGATTVAPSGPGAATAAFSGPGNAAARGGRKRAGASCRRRPPKKRKQCRAHAKKRQAKKHGTSRSGSRNGGSK